MFKDTVTYTDYNGVERTETLYFNISKPEIIAMEHSVEGGLSNFLQRIVDEKDANAIVNYFIEFIKMSYGIKSDDGKRFVKSKESTEAFMQSEAYSEFFMKLLSEPDYQIKFIKGALPADLDMPNTLPSK